VTELVLNRDHQSRKGRDFTRCEVQDHWRAGIDDTSERLTVRKVEGWLRHHPLSFATSLVSFREFGRDSRPA
jgi:hypothetical protein